MESSLAQALGINSSLFHWLVVPLLIFLARICDVSINTLRVMFVINGRRKLAPFIGFFESLIWLLAISQILQNVGSVFSYIAYAGGFATGIYVGMILEEKLAYGKVIVRVITDRDADGLLSELIEKGYGITNIPGEGSRGPVNLIFTVVKRSDLKHLLGIIDRFNPNAFYTIENVRYASEPPSDFSDIEGQGMLAGILGRFKMK